MENVLCLASKYFPLVKDVILSCAVIIGAYVALKGLNTWKRQLSGQTEYDLARRVLKFTFKFREAINTVRYHFMVYSAEPDLPKEALDRLSPTEKEWHALAQAYQKRWDIITKARTELETELLEAEALWGKKIKEKVWVLFGLQGELFGAIEEHLDVMNPNIDYGSRTPEERKKSRAIMYARGDRTKDDYLNSLETAVEDIENELKPFIKRK